MRSQRGPGGPGPVEAGQAPCSRASAGCLLHKHPATQTEEGWQPIQPGPAASLDTGDKGWSFTARERPPRVQHTGGGGGEPQVQEHQREAGLRGVSRPPQGASVTEAETWLGSSPSLGHKSSADPDGPPLGHHPQSGEVRTARPSAAMAHTCRLKRGSEGEPFRRGAAHSKETGTPRGFLEGH